MQCLAHFFVIVSLGLTVCALPVKEVHEEKNNTIDGDSEEKGEGEDWELSLEYGRYLKEVVQALESDQTFRKKLETAEVADIKSGKIARELHFVDHKVRTKLDELKRRELERLRHLAIKEHEKSIGMDRNMLKLPVHVDHKNPTRFEIEDLRKLIVKTTSDLEEVDKKRREEFKNYELEKEFERKMDLEGLDEQHRNEAELKHDEEMKKHQEHPKLHHPGSKQQLEEVWEETDHLSPEDFNPKTFFHLHDLDGNGYWDELEVKALFKQELDKMYDPNAPEDDITERYEEMERMREHVFRESDVNRDGLISYDEFVEQTRKREFEQDEGWKGLDQQEAYSQQEYQEFEHRRQEELQRLVESGAIPPPYYHRPPQPGQLPPHAAPGYGIPPQPLPNGVIPQGYQALPQSYHIPPQGHQGAPQGYQGVPQGYAPPSGQQLQQLQYNPNNIQNQVPAQQNSNGQQQWQQQQPPVGQQQWQQQQHQQMQQQYMQQPQQPVQGGQYNQYQLPGQQQQQQPPPPPQQQQQEQQPQQQQQQQQQQPLQGQLNQPMQNQLPPQQQPVQQPLIPQQQPNEQPLNKVESIPLNQPQQQQQLPIQGQGQVPNVPIV